jgi:N6-adenosine-specific RNA methylase IME4
MTINPKFRSLIPPLAPEELAQLEANIIADGCRDPLVTWRDMLIDGHNRYDICTRHGIAFKTVEMEFADEEAAMDWMDANQLGRRNLKPEVASILRGRRYNRTKKVAHRPANNGDKVATLPQRTSETLAKEHGVSSRTIIRDGKKAEAVEKLALTNPEAAKAITDGVKKFNEVKREMKKEQLAKPIEKPTGKFRIFYADPPWSYNDKCDAGAVQSGGAEKHYPSMTIPELCALPIKAMAEPDAVLFLWTTSPLLFECAPLFEAWGFKYKACFVWDKVKHNMGHYNSVRHEFLLICTRGSCTPEVVKLFDSVQSIEKTAKHSEKPQEFRDIIDTLYPHGERIELFARAKHKGWNTWGNEA